MHAVFNSNTVMIYISCVSHTWKHVSHQKHMMTSSLLQRKRILGHAVTMMSSCILTLTQLYVIRFSALLLPNLFLTSLLDTVMPVCLLIQKFFQEFLIHHMNFLVFCVRC